MSLKHEIFDGKTILKNCLKCFVDLDNRNNGKKIFRSFFMDKIKNDLKTLLVRNNDFIDTIVMYQFCYKNLINLQMDEDDKALLTVALINICTCFNFSSIFQLMIFLGNWIDHINLPASNKTIETSENKKLVVVNHQLFGFFVSGINIQFVIKNCSKLGILRSFDVKRNFLTKVYYYIDKKVTKLDSKIVTFLETIRKKVILNCPDCTVSGLEHFSRNGKIANKFKTKSWEKRFPSIFKQVQSDYEGEEDEGDEEEKLNVEMETQDNGVMIQNVDSEKETISKIAQDLQDFSNQIPVDKTIENQIDDFFSTFTLDNLEENVDYKTLEPLNLPKLEQNDLNILYELEDLFFKNKND